MKKLFLCLTAAAALLTGCDKDDDWGLPALPDPADVCSAMDDPAFRAFCIREFDADGNGKVSPAEARAVTIIDNAQNIQSLKGIVYFENLTELGRIRGKITEADLSKNTKLTEIGNDAFRDCFSLACIRLPETVRRIGKRAFFNCYKLTEVHFAGTLTFLGEDAFSRCSALTVPPSLNGLTELDPGVFNECSKLPGITLPETLIHIHNGAFRGCMALKDIALPASLKTIGSTAFMHSGIQSISFGKGLTSIARFAFCGCAQLQRIVFPENLSLIEEGVFMECGKLEKIVLPEKLTTIVDRAFCLCTNLSEVTLNGHIEQIGIMAFFECPLAMVTSLAATPPELIEGNGLTAPVLYVPAASVEAYKNSDWRNYFTQILPI